MLKTVDRMAGMLIIKESVNTIPPYFQWKERGVVVLWIIQRTWENWTRRPRVAEMFLDLGRFLDRMRPYFYYFVIIL